MFDLIIVGGGPGGSNLARLIAQTYGTKYKVCLLDKRQLDQPEDSKHQKPCGGLLSPDAQGMLAKLGLTIPVSILEDPQLFKVRTIDFDNHIERYYQRHYFNMNRERFDRYLYDLIPDTIDRRCGVLVTGASKVGDHWQVTYRDYNHPSRVDDLNESHQEVKNELNKSDVKQTVSGRLLICADGANSYIRRILMSWHPVPKRYISIQKWYPLSKSMPYYTGIFDSDITDYYSWTIQKNHAFILGTAIPVGKNVSESFELLRDKVSKYLDIPLDDPIKSESAFIERTLSNKALCWHGLGKNQNLKNQKVKGHCLKGLLFLGEAAGATSPTSAEGFSYALQSSWYLCKALDQGILGIENRYAKHCRIIEWNIFIKKLKMPAMYNRFIRNLVMRSGITSF
jgi:flavin-dependent dehydrogenase